MADRNSAEIFGMVFKALANAEPIDESARQTLALKFWKAQSRYDFAPYQMYCEEALIKLGLARRVDDGGGDIQYLDHTGEHWAK